MSTITKEWLQAELVSPAYSLPAAQQQEVNNNA